MEKMLEGVKVLDMCVAAAGPSASRMLVDFGATDIMVEPLEGQEQFINVFGVNSYASIGNFNAQFQGIGVGVFSGYRQRNRTFMGVFNGVG